MPFKGLLFDLGNTLLHFRGDWPEISKLADNALAASLINAGLNLDSSSFPREFRSRLDTYHSAREDDCVEITTASVLKNLLADFGYPAVSDQVIIQAMESLYQESQAHWIPEYDSVPTLALLKADGYRLGVISNAGDDDDVQKLVNKAGVRPYLDFVISSASCGIRKPAPQIFAIALDHWGYAPHDTAMIGDTLDADVLGAKRAGIFSIWVTRRADTPANRANRGAILPDAAVGTLSELPDLLGSLP